METANVKDANQRSKDDVSRGRIANMLPEIVAFLLAFGGVFEKATLNPHFVYSSCEELHPFEVDCGIDSQGDANVQVILDISGLCTLICSKKTVEGSPCQPPPSPTNTLYKSKKMVAESYHK